MPFQIRVLNLEEMGSLEVIIAHQMLHSLSRHMHDSFCTGIIQSGSRQCVLPFGEYTASAGQIIVINPGEIHACRSGNAEPYNYSMLCVKNAAAVMRFLQHTKKEHLTIPYFPSPVLNNNSLFHKIAAFARLSMSSASLLELQTAFLDLFAHLVLSYGDCKTQLTKNSPADQTAIDEIYHYIARHYADEISLQQLSSLFHISPYHLTRCFTKQFGIPPHVCQTLFRIKQAKQLLESGITPAIAAAETGFADQSHLSRRFKEGSGNDTRAVAEWTYLMQDRRIHL